MSDTATPTFYSIRYLELGERAFKASLLDPDGERKIMEEMGITPAEGRSQLVRWMEYMAELNDVDVEVIRAQVVVMMDPLACAEADIEYDKHLARFIWLIA